MDGYKGIPETELLNCLAEAGIEEGSYIPGIDWSRAEDLIYDAFPQVTWVQLVYDGRKVFLNISEGKINTEDEEMSLVKSKEGMEAVSYTHLRMEMLLKEDSTGQEPTPARTISQ